jgi:hypothetical protein
MELAPSGTGGENPSSPTKCKTGNGGKYRRTSKKKMLKQFSQFNATLAQSVEQ